MVFDTEDAPRSEEAFLAWYEARMDAAEEGDYMNPATTTQRLRGWYEEMCKNWPSMNDPELMDDIEQSGDRLTGYTFGTDLIYCDFRWSIAEEAYKAALDLAEKHKVGFFNASGAGFQVVFPSQ